MGWRKLRQHYRYACNKQRQKIAISFYLHFISPLPANDERVRHDRGGYRVAAPRISPSRFPSTAYGPRVCSAHDGTPYHRAAERRHLIRPDAVTRHAPDVAVEVLSPSTAAADRGRKMRTFARYGVPEYWIVDPALERIEIHVLDAGACRLAQAASPGDTVRPVLLAGADVRRRPRLSWFRRDERGPERPRRSDRQVLGRSAKARSADRWTGPGGGVRLSVSSREDGLVRLAVMSRQPLQDHVQPLIHPVQLFAHLAHLLPDVVNVTLEVLQPLIKITGRHIDLGGSLLVDLAADEEGGDKVGQGGSGIQDDRDAWNLFGGESRRRRYGRRRFLCGGWRYGRRRFLCGDTASHQPALDYRHRGHYQSCNSSNDSRDA